MMCYERCIDKALTTCFASLQMHSHVKADQRDKESLRTPAVILAEGALGLSWQLSKVHAYAETEGSDLPDLHRLSMHRAQFAGRQLGGACAEDTP